MSPVLTNPANTITLSPEDNYMLSAVDNIDHPFRYDAGGKTAGDSNYGSYSIFLRFALPARAPGATITSATLDLHAESEAGSSYPLSVYVIPNSWEVSDMRDGNRPIASGQPLLSFNVGAGEDAHLNVTSAVDAAYQIDGVITLLIANAEYNYNAQNFSVAKALNISISAP